MENFEKASRTKLRFATTKGDLATEDLWDLNLSSLDSIAKAVNNQLRNEGEESFIPTTTNKPSSNNDLRLDILKHVIAVKVAEQDKRQARAETLAKLAQLKELAQTKATEQLASKSLEEINAEIEKLVALV